MRQRNENCKLLTMKRFLSKHYDFVLTDAEFCFSENSYQHTVPPDNKDTEIHMDQIRLDHT
jgi:hypothetical protein